MICEPFDIVDVPFPFSDRKEVKHRKALVLSNKIYNETNCASILMMITSARAGSWQGDVSLGAWQAAGLKKPCIARLKLFTLDNALILDKVGVLASSDRKAVARALNEHLPR